MIKNQKTDELGASGDAAAPEELFPFQALLRSTLVAPVTPVTRSRGVGDDYNDWSGQRAADWMIAGDVNHCHNTDEVRPDPPVL